MNRSKTERPRTPSTPHTTPKGNSSRKSIPKSTPIASPIRNARGKVISPASSTSNESSTTLVLSNPIKKEPRCYVKTKAATKSEMSLKVTRIEEKPGGSKVTTVKEYTMVSPKNLSFTLDNNSIGF